MKNRAKILDLTRLISVSSFGLFLFSCSLSFLENPTTADNPKPTFGEIIRGDSCSNGCWQTIEPNVSTVQDVDRLLNSIGVKPHILRRLEDGSPMIYEWEYPELALLPSSDERLRFIIVSFSENGQVIRVIVPVDVCITTIIEEFGLPEKIIEDSYGETELLYPTEGFFVMTQGARIQDFIKTSLAEFPEGEELSTEHLDTILDESCTDAFSH